MKIAWVMTTANRAPGENYVFQTAQALLAEGVHLHLFATNPDVAWLAPLEGTISLHVPDRRLSRIENGAAAMSLEHRDADWVVHLEDDVRPCEDVVGSVTRWLEKYERRGRLFLLWSREHYYTVARTGWCVRHPIERPFGAVAFALRREDALAFGRWATAKGPSWRDGLLRLRGFDKMLRAWHMAAYHGTPILAARPSLFQHVGRDSTLVGFPRQPANGQLIVSPTFNGRPFYA